MSKTFTRHVQSTPKQLFQELKSALAGSGDISFSGSEHSGSVSGRGFRGNYQVTSHGTGAIVDLTIIDKPFFVPWAIIEAKIDNLASRLAG